MPTNVPSQWLITLPDGTPAIARRIKLEDLPAFHKWRGVVPDYVVEGHWPPLVVLREVGE